ncbi:oxidoreductase [Trichoderma arundinaceum]|uniref:Oxidoreductase n=1 Tax=Trichoderma arundinaceum TaxID=490622 RepID=A0A395N9P2_TRIAR|nr:oxidoreductase [Trichoderma arundinaceum]
MPYPYPETITGPELVAEYTPIIKGKTILTTGVSPNSLGAAYVTAIAAGQPKLLILAGRDLSKVNQTIEAIAKEHPDIKTRALQLDLNSFAAVRKAAEEVNSWDDVPVIDVLMNNAGIMAVPYKICEDGFESHLTANHLGHFLFTNLIAEKLLAAKESRVVNVSSGGHFFSGIRHADVNFDEGKTYEKWTAYGQSKTANILFSISLAKRLGERGLLSFSLNPGSIATNLGMHLDFAPGGDIEKLSNSVCFYFAVQLSRLAGAPFGFQKAVPMITAEQGIATHIFASFDPSLKAHNGAYLLEKARLADYYVDQVSPAAISDIEAEKLWALSVKAVGL